jgi:uncharacterized membrane protein
METVLRTLNGVVVAVCQMLAMLVISIGIAKAMFIFLRDVLTPGRSITAIQASRLELGHSFSLGLGFLIGASILKTTLAPTWTDIGQLAAIIAIRTVLNYFLLRDISTQTPAAASARGRTTWRQLFLRPERADARTEPGKDEASGEQNTDAGTPARGDRRDGE